MVTNGPPYIEGSPLPKVSCSKPDEVVVEITRRTKFDPFGNSGKREIGEKVSKLSNIPNQTTQNPVEKIVEYSLKPDLKVFRRELGKFLGS